jgi:hypothetical protein
VRAILAVVVLVEDESIGLLGAVVEDGSAVMMSIEDELVMLDEAMMGKCVAWWGDDRGDDTDGGG